MVSFDAHPDGYRHWRLRIEGEIAWLELDVDEQGGSRPGYELKLNSYDLGVDIELYDAMQRLRFEHPEVRAVVLTSGKDKVFCAGANIRMLAASSARVEGELLQVHQRDPQRHGGRHRALRPDLPRRGQRLLRGRRLRAGAGLRPHHARRRQLLDRVAARGAAARRAARHRRADPRRGQARRPQGPRRRVRHPARRREGPHGGRLAAGRRARSRRAGSPRPYASARGRLAGRATRPDEGGITCRARTADHRGLRRVPARDRRAGPATRAPSRSPCAARRPATPPGSRTRTSGRSP